MPGLLWLLWIAGRRLRCSDFRMQRVAVEAIEAGSHDEVGVVAVCCIRSRRYRCHTCRVHTCSVLCVWSSSRVADSQRTSASAARGLRCVACRRFTRREVAQSALIATWHSLARNLPPDTAQARRRQRCKRSRGVFEVPRQRFRFDLFGACGVEWVRRDAFVPRLIAWALCAMRVGGVGSGGAAYGSPAGADETALPLERVHAFLA